jgi:uncharacterized membrane protein
VSGNAWAISADGKTIVGYIHLPVTEGASYNLRYLPAVWKDNVLTVLAHPTEGVDMYTRGYVLRDVSDDGNVVIGYSESNGSERVGCWWRVSEPEKANYFLTDNPEFFHTKTESGRQIPDKYPTAEKLSADGKIITSYVADRTVGTTTPFNYNIETGQVEKIVTGEKGGTGLLTLPSGELVYTIGRSDTYIYDGTTSTPLYRWMLDKYNVSVNEYGQYAIRDVSSSGKVMVGSEPNGQSYTTIVISL